VSRPLVFLGDTRSRALLGRVRPLGWGRLFIDRRPDLAPDEPWVLDNGAFRCWKSGEAFDWGRFLETVRRAQAELPEPYFAIAPDEVGGGAESLWWSVECVSRIAWEWPWYLPVQDGMDPDEVAELLPQYFAGLFLGGTDRFKVETGHVWAELCAEQGKPLHYGRAGTLRKLAHAIRLGCDSLDSAFPLWERARLEAFIAAWTAGHSDGVQRVLEFAA
jgi:hypothetical protein